MLKINHFFRLCYCFFLSLSIYLSDNSYADLWQKNLAISGFDRVHLYTPSSQSPIGDGRALLVVLHGCMQPIDAFITANLDSAAQTYGMVIAVPDAKFKAGFNCWAYWNGEKSRDIGDYKNLIRLAIELSADPHLNIDSDQVYIAGLSSGAVFAHTTACLAPDIFAGFGTIAGPSIGTSAAGAINNFEAADVKSRCLAYAGQYADSLSSQIAVFAQGRKDSLVDPGYLEQNAQGMAKAYGIDNRQSPREFGEDALSAEETVWQNGRVSMLWLDNLDHSWSGGEGAKGQNISSASINFADYLGNFFTENNRRIKTH